MLEIQRHITTKYHVADVTNNVGEILASFNSKDVARQYVGLRAENDKLKQDSTTLKKFIREFVTVKCWGYQPEIDGVDVREVAERMGIIIETKATSENAEMSDADVEEGDPWYIFSDIMQE